MPKDKDKLNKEFKEAFSNFYEEFSHHENIFQHNATIAMLYRACNDYALAAIKSLLWINGGALIAIAPLVQAFGVEFSDKVLYAAFLYSGGLASIIITALFAYISCSYGLVATGNDRNADYNRFILRHVKHLFLEEGIKNIQDSENEYKTVHRKKQFRAEIFEVLAVILGVISLTLFILGTFYLLNSLPLEEVSLAEQKLEQIEVILSE